MCYFQWPKFCPIKRKSKREKISLRSKRFLASSSRKVGQEQKKKGMTGKGEGIHAVTRLETLATQATRKSTKVSRGYFIYAKLCIPP